MIILTTLENMLHFLLFDVSHIYFVALYLYIVGYTQKPNIDENVRQS